MVNLIRYREIFSSILINNKLYFFSLAVMLTGFLFSLYWGERVMIGYGLGSDGSIYGGWAQTDPVELLRSKTIGLYHSTRILPSIIVHYSAQFFNYPLGDLTHPDGVINAFLIFNSTLIMGSAILLYLIARHLNWMPPVLMMGFVALFVNFPILKLSHYNPTLTDVAAFFFGIFTFYAYIKGRQFTLFMVSVLGAFTWPTILYTALPLLIFQAKKLDYKVHTPLNYSNLITALFSGLIVVGTMYVYYVDGLRLPHGATPVNESFILVSAITFFAYVWLMLRPFVDLTFFQLALFSYISWRGIVLAVILVAAVKLAIVNYSSNVLGGPTVLLYVKYLGLCSIVKPMINVVANASYFGSSFILMLLLWKDIVTITKQYGLGLFFVLIITNLMSVGTESRNLMAAWPILAILTCDALNRRGVSWSFVYLNLAIALLISRFWLPLNQQPWGGPYQEFPFQIYFMNFGPWLSDIMYMVFLTFTLVIFIVLSITMRKMNSVEIKA